jgi:hypothetical protein
MKGYAMTNEQKTQEAFTYAAKEAYRLFATTGLKHTTINGLECHYFYSKTLDKEYIMIFWEDGCSPVIVKASWKY